MTQCVICLNFLDKNLVVGPCGHPFHEKCIFGWIRIKESCPHCVKKLNARMLCRLHIEPLKIFQEMVKEPKNFEELPEKVRVEISEPKLSTTKGEETSGNATIRELQSTIAEQHEKLSTCLKRLSKLEVFQKGAVNTRVKLEDRAASLDLMRQQLRSTVARFKRKTTGLEEENEKLKGVTKVQRHLERFMTGDDFSLTEILDQKSPLEQAALLFPMVNYLRDKNEKIRRAHIDLEKKFDTQRTEELMRTQELRANLKKTQRRFVKAEAKRDRYKQKLEKINKDQLVQKQRMKQANNPILSESVTITPGVIQPYQKESKTDTQPLSLRSKPIAAPLKGLHPFNHGPVNKGIKRKVSTRSFGFGTVKKAGSRLSTASISSGFDGRGGSSKVLIKKLKKRRLGNSLF